MGKAETYTHNSITIGLFLDHVTCRCLLVPSPRAQPAAAMYSAGCPSLYQACLCCSLCLLAIQQGGKLREAAELTPRPRATHCWAFKALCLHQHLAEMSWLGCTHKSYARPKKSALAQAPACPATRHCVQICFFRPFQKHLDPCYTQIRSAVLAICALRPCRWCAWPRRPWPLLQAQCSP